MVKPFLVSPLTKNTQPFLLPSASKYMPLYSTPPSPPPPSPRQLPWVGRVFSLARTNAPNEY